MKQKKAKKELLIKLNNKLFLILPTVTILITALTLATFTIPSFAQSEGTNETMQNAGESANQTGENMQQGANKTGEAIQGNASDMGSKVTEGAKNLAENIGEGLKDLAK
jgi:ABC-type Na+ efflux pump permease subunit